MSFLGPASMNWPRVVPASVSWPCPWGVGVAFPVALVFGTLTFPFDSSAPLSPGWKISGFWFLIHTDIRSQLTWLGSRWWYIASQISIIGTSLVVQWLRLCFSIVGGEFWYWVRELSSYMLCDMAKNKIKNYLKLEDWPHQLVSMANVESMEYITYYKIFFVKLLLWVCFLHQRAALDWLNIANWPKVRGLQFPGLIRAISRQAAVLESTWTSTCIRHSVM